MRMRTLLLLALLFMISGAAGINRILPSLFDPLRVRLAGAKTVDQVMERLEPEYRETLTEKFRKAGCVFPRAAVTFVALKRERTLEAWCQAGGQWAKVDEYSILAASGQAGPKLKEGDLQVPEGLYSIPAMNPNSRFHLSMKVGYPNAFDRQKALEDGRGRLGGDIFIHGSFFSIGCLAMGDGPIEELFYMTEKTGRARVGVIIMPYDFRRYKPVPPPGAPKWTGELYQRINAQAQKYR